MDVAGRRDGAAGAADPQQVGDAPQVDREEGVEDGGDQDRAAVVGLDAPSRSSRGSGCRPRAERSAARLPSDSPNWSASSTSGLPRDRSAATRPRFVGRRGIGVEQVTLDQAAGPLDRVEQRVGVAEVPEQRDDVGDRLVEGGRVEARPLEEVRLDAVEQGMRRLVGDDVCRQAGVDDLAGQVAPGSSSAGREVAEQQTAQACGRSRRSASCIACG